MYLGGVNFWRMKKDDARIADFYSQAVEPLKNGQTINDITEKASLYVEKHDYNAATGLMKAVGEHKAELGIY